MDEALRQQVIARHTVALACQESSSAVAVGVSAARITFDISRISISEKIEASGIYSFGRLVIIGVGVSRQVAFKLDPVKSLDPTLAVSIYEEVLLRVGHIVENKALAACVFEGLIKFEPDGWCSGRS